MKIKVSGCGLVYMKNIPLWAVGEEDFNRLEENSGWRYRISGFSDFFFPLYINEKYLVCLDFTEKWRVEFFLKAFDKRHINVLKRAISIRIANKLTDKQPPKTEWRFIAEGLFLR